MALKIAKKPTFSATAEVFTPNDRCGHDRSTLTVKFFRATREELDELRGLTHLDVLRRKIAGWDDFQDQEGNSLEFTPENLEVLLNIPEAVYAIVLVFWGSVVKAKEKN
ncbi:Domain of unknown function DUF1789 [Nitrosomonas sp. Is79A3]|uniref:hypothetical protein n=1 Tax=Nitrosomonas sp. (strain Is79A3) TaxID=261292 RepID=UPI000215CA20